MEGGKKKRVRKTFKRRNKKSKLILPEEEKNALK